MLLNVLLLSAIYNNLIRTVHHASTPVLDSKRVQIDILGISVTLVSRYIVILTKTTATLIYGFIRYDVLPCKSH